MKADVKAKWVAALRSGRYRQGRGFLNRNGEYCCLGVLCELAKADGVDIHITAKSKVLYGSGSYIKYDGEFEVLPASVVEWAGLESRSPSLSARPEEVTGDDDQEVYEFTLAEINDEYGAPFDKIANLIEEHL